MRAADDAPARVARYAVPAATLAGLAVSLIASGPLAVQPDSAGYLEWIATRSVGYPLFLSVVKATVGMPMLPLVQSLLFCSALFLLGRELARTLGSHLLAGGVVLTTGINPELAKYHALVLTESMSMTLAILAFALLARYLRSGRTSALLGAAAAVAVVGSFRPSLSVLIWIPIGAALFRSGARWRDLALGLLALAVVVGTVGEIDHMRLAKADVPPNQTLAETLIGKVAPLIDGDVVSSRPEFARALAEAAVPLQRIERGLPSWDLVYMARAPYYDHARFIVVPAVLARLDVAEKDVPAAEMTLARETIAQRPLEYLRDWAINFYALWTLADLKTAGTAAAGARLAAELEESYGLIISSGQRPAIVAWAVKGALAASFLGGIWLTLRLLARRERGDPVTIVGAFAFLAVMTVFGATAALQAGLPRYALACWPLQMIVLGALASTLLRRVQRP